MTDEGKRCNELKLRLTDRELADLARLSILEERPIAEYVVRLLRWSMYGSLGVKAAALQGPVGAGESQ